MASEKEIKEVIKELNAKIEEEHLGIRDIFEILPKEKADKLSAEMAAEYEASDKDWFDDDKNFLPGLSAMDYMLDAGQAGIDIHNKYMRKLAEEIIKERNK